MPEENVAVVDGNNKALIAQTIDELAAKPGVKLLAAVGLCIMEAKDLSKSGKLEEKKAWRAPELSAVCKDVYKRQLLELWDAARWPVLLLTAVIYTTAVYHLTPNVKQGRFRWVTPGSVLAIAGMVSAVLGFNFYVDRFSTFNETYGVVGSFIVLLLGLWIINVALLFGGEVDAELERVRELLAGIEAERSIQLPPRDVSMIKAVVAAEEQFVTQGPVSYTHLDVYKRQPPT